MRDSITHELEPAELAVVVGSTEKTALYQEMGTSRGIPPRPFLSLGMQHAAVRRRNFRQDCRHHPVGEIERDHEF